MWLLDLRSFIVYIVLLVSTLLLHRPQPSSHPFPMVSKNASTAKEGTSTIEPPCIPSKWAKHYTILSQARRQQYWYKSFLECYDRPPEFKLDPIKRQELLYRVEVCGATLENIIWVDYYSTLVYRKLEREHVCAVYTYCTAHRFNSRSSRTIIEAPFCSPSSYWILAILASNSVRGE